MHHLMSPIAPHVGLVLSGYINIIDGIVINVKNIFDVSIIYYSTTPSRSLSKKLASRHRLIFDWLW